MVRLFSFFYRRYFLDRIALLEDELLIPRILIGVVQTFGFDEEFVVRVNYFSVHDPVADLLVKWLNSLDKNTRQLTAQMIL